jgi:hypothetical protein
MNGEPGQRKGEIKSFSTIIEALRTNEIEGGEI